MSFVIFVFLIESIPLGMGPCVGIEIRKCDGSSGFEQPRTGVNGLVCQYQRDLGLEFF